MKKNKKLEKLLENAVDHYVKGDNKRYIVDKNNIIRILSKEIKHCTGTQNISFLLKRYFKLGLDKTSKKDEGRYCLSEQIKKEIKDKNPNLSTSKKIIDFFKECEKRLIIKG